MTFIDVHTGTDEERRVSIVNDGDRAILAIGVPTGEPDRFTFTGAYMTRHPLMVLIANLTEVATALPWEDTPPAPAVVVADLLDPAYHESERIARKASAPEAPPLDALEQKWSAMECRARSSSLVVNNHVFPTAADPDLRRCDGCDRTAKMLEGLT